MSRHIVLEALFPWNSRTAVKLADWSHQSLTAGCLSDCSHIQIVKVTAFEMGDKTEKELFPFSHRRGRGRGWGWGAGWPTHVAAHVLE